MKKLFHERVRIRKECEKIGRPCPYVSCRWHLYLDLTKTGRLKINFPGKSDETVWEVLLRMPETCALDVAGRGPHTLQQIGNFLGLTRERVRQIQRDALNKLMASKNSREILEDLSSFFFEDFDRGESSCYEISIDW